MNIEVKRAQLDAEAAEVEALLGDAIDKAMAGHDLKDLNTKGLTERIQRIKDDKAELDRREEVQKSHANDPRIAALRMYGGDLGSQPDIPVSKKSTGAQLSPLSFPESSLKAMHKAFQNRQAFSIRAVEKKGFSTVDSLLPAELAPGVVAHDWCTALVTELGVRWQFGAARPTEQPGGPDRLAGSGADAGRRSPLAGDLAAALALGLGDLHGVTGLAASARSRASFSFSTK